MADVSTESVNNCVDKMSFETKQSAQTAATVAYFQRGIRLRPYRCKDCGLWHLTSGQK
jgi:hypothetical protein